jgi:hypothetical protein
MPTLEATARTTASPAPHEELEPLRETVRRCPQIGICKTDFLGTGVCPAGERGRYAAYYPEGRMAIVRAVLEGADLPLTPRLVDVARSCPDCDVCDKQTYFAFELRARPVVDGLRAWVEGRLASEDVCEPEQDELLRELRGVVGDEWATNDLAVLVAYSRDMFPATGPTMPSHVAMPATTDEVAALVRLCNARGVAYTARASGGNGLGLALGRGVIIDVSRMKKLDVADDGTSATVGAGINSIELQSAVRPLGLRANTSEAHSHLCSNQVGTGIYSPFAHRYGCVGDNYVDAVVVTPEGDVVRTDEPSGAYLTAPRRPPVGRPNGVPGICTELTVRLHRRLPDERGVFVPFADLGAAEAFVRELGRRDVGLAVAILSSRFFSTFMAPTDDARDDFADVARNWLKLEYLVMVIGDGFAIDAAARLTDEPVIDEELVRHLILGLPELSSPEALQVYDAFAQEEHPYRKVLGPMRHMLLENTRSGPEVVASAVEPRFRDFFAELYARPEMTDLGWLNSFRIVSCRLARRKAFLPLLSIYSLDEPGGAEAICRRLAAYGERYALEHMLGFVTPMESGRLAVLEYDFYFSPDDPDVLAQLAKGYPQLALEVFRLQREIPGYLPGYCWLNQGLTRKSSFLYQPAWRR